MRDRGLAKALKGALRQSQKRLFRLVRLSRKWLLRRKIEQLCTCLLLFAILLRLIYFSTPQRVEVPGKDSKSVPDLIHSQGQQPDKDFFFKREAELRAQAVCKITHVHANVDELRLCGNFLTNNAGKKIVGLVEVRNAEKTISSFLSALSNTVDSVVLVDDHSTDGTRRAILEFNANVANMRTGQRAVEVLLNKTGPWIRDELRDRELLLEAGRRVGGSHFVVLDYDEYLSSNCVENGLLRNTILGLNPGESLYLPWVEVWKSTSLQRVLSGDPSMNFLKRRQIAIFADDKEFHYTAENSVARHIGTNSSEHGTIHVVRCPRTVCPQPRKYLRQRAELLYPSKVKHLNDCAIVEVRFLSLSNVLLKSAWYEALGRVTGSKDGVTSGKMVRMLFPRHDFRSIKQEDGFQEEVPLTSVSSTFFDGYKDFDAGLYNQVEAWRAKDLLQWMQEQGPSRFRGLEAWQQIDFSALRAALDRMELTREDLHYVPRVKTASLVVAVESNSMISRLLRHLKWSELQLTEEFRSFAVQLSNPKENLVQYEHWKSDIERSILSALAKSQDNQLFISLSKVDEGFRASFLELLRNEFPHFHTTILFDHITTTSSSRESLCLKTARAFAGEVGSHFRVLVIPMENFGSFAVLQWVRDSLSGIPSKAKPQFSRENNEALLKFAEVLHEDARKRSMEVRLAPVARLIFSLNVGRSGSKYLSKILASVNEVISANHEVPCGNGYCSGGGAVRMQNVSLRASYQSRASVKLPLIRSEVSSTSGKSNKTSFMTRGCGWSEHGGAFWSAAFPHERAKHGATVVDIGSNTGCSIHTVRDVVYAETNPNFKSWFYDVVLDKLPQSGYRIDVVVIRRYVAAVLKSMYETGYFTSRDGYNWMETAAGANSNIKIKELQNDGELDAYEKILSYVLASEARFRHIQKAYGGAMVESEESERRVEFIETRSEELFSRNGTLKLLRRLNLAPSSATGKLIGVINDKYRGGGAKKRRLHTTLDECEERVAGFLEKLRAGNPDVGALLMSLDRFPGFDYAR